MAIKNYRKDGKQFYLVEVKVRDENGKQHFRSRQGITSERKAQEAEFEIKKELEKLVNERPPTTWKHWVDHCVARMKLEMAPSTCINYEGRLSKWVTPEWENREIQSISKSDVHSLIFEKIGEHQMTPHSLKTIFKMIKRIFEMAAEEGLLDRNPSKGITVRVPEVDQKVLTNDEVGVFLREARICNHPFYPIWTMALLTGMRSGELYALEWSDINFETRTLRVSRQWTNKCGITPTKNRRIRVVPMNENLVNFLKDWRLKSGNRTSGPVLPGLTEWTNGEQAQVTARFCRQIGITPVKFHDLRATFITNLLSQGVSLARVMAIVGHSQIKTTNGYLRKAGIEVQGGTDNLGYEVPGDQAAEVLSFETGFGREVHSELST